MATPTSSQAIFEQYLRGELSLDAAADALTALILQRKASGASTSDIGLVRPTGVHVTAMMLSRADALFDEMDRRAGTG